MGLLARNEGDDDALVEVGGSGQKVYLESCRTCGTPLALIGEPPPEGPICEACNAAAQA